MAKLNADSSEVLSAAAKSISYNIILQVLMRIVSFVSNAIIIRYISRDVLGVINVRLMLLYSTLQCLSREAFRRSCLCKISDRNHHKIINLLWLSLPVCFFTGLLLCYVWLNILHQPDPKEVLDYRTGVYVVFISVLIEIISEPLYVLGQSFHFVALKVVIEGLLLTCKSVSMVVLLLKWPQYGIYNFCFSQIFSSCVYTASYYLYFHWYFRYKNEDSSSKTFPLNSISQILPTIRTKEECIDHDVLSLSWSFYKQTILKQFLTEGERYIMTLMSLISFAEQGLYDVVSNLGSLAARLVFLPIEESGYLLFSHLVKRGCPAAKQENPEVYFNVLMNLLKLMLLLGLTILVFGYSFSQLLLLLYGGEDLSQSIAWKLLRFHCFYILFLAINGVSECFVFAAMDSSEIDKYNKKMVAFSVIFLAVSYYFTSLFGCIGFLIANCLNAGLRIVHSFYFILCHFDITLRKVIGSFLPHYFVLMTFAASFVVTAVSENYYCCLQGFKFITLHFILGFCCFSAVICITFMTDKELIFFVKRQLARSEKKTS